MNKISTSIYNIIATTFRQRLWPLSLHRRRRGCDILKVKAVPLVHDALLVLRLHGVALVQEVVAALAELVRAILFLGGGSQSLGDGGERGRP